MFDYNENDPYRPVKLLDECLDKYGLGKNRSSSPDHKTVAYFRVDEFIDMEWTPRWVLGGISENPAESLSQAFSSAMRLMRDSHETQLETTKVSAYALVSHGMGKCSFINTTTNEICEWDELPESDKALVEREASHDLHRKVRVGEELPTRVVNIITPTGLAADVSIWWGDEVHVETCEEWVFDGKGTVPRGGGQVDDALMGTMTFSTLVYEAIQRELPLTAEGLMKVAWETADNAELVAHLMRVIATGVETGLLTQEDFM